VSDPGDSSEAGRAQQSQGTQWPQHREGEHDQVEWVRPNEVPARRRQVEAHAVVDREGRPDGEVSCAEGGPGGGWQIHHQRSDQDHQEDQGENEHRPLGRAIPLLVAD